MKKVLLLSAVVLLVSAFAVQAQDMELVRYGEAGDSTEATRQLRQVQLTDMEGTMRVQEKTQLMDGSGEMIKEQLQNRINSMQSRKTQLREELKTKTKLQDKKQVLEQYKGNEISEFAKGINSRMNSQSARVDNLNKQAEGFADRMNGRIDKLEDESKRRRATEMKDSVLQRREVLGNRLGDLAEKRAQLAELGENADWQDFQNQMSDYRSLLQEIKDELKEAIAEGAELETIVE